MRNEDLNQAVATAAEAVLDALDDHGEGVHRKLPPELQALRVHAHKIFMQAGGLAAVLGSNEAYFKWRDGR